VLSAPMGRGFQKSRKVDARQLRPFQFMEKPWNNHQNHCRLHMAPQNKSTFLGKLVFALTAAAMVYFFWWLLIFDHGVVKMG
jgi:hypothetical protein